jgi:hypothetical protein
MLFQAVVSSTEETKKKPRAARRASAAKRSAASSDSDNDSYNGSYDIKEIQKRDRMLRNRESAALSRSVLFLRAFYICSVAPVWDAASTVHFAVAEDSSRGFESDCCSTPLLFVITERGSARRQNL